MFFRRDEIVRSWVLFFLAQILRYFIDLLSNKSRTDQRREDEIKGPRNKLTPVEPNNKNPNRGWEVEWKIVFINQLSQVSSSISISRKKKKKKKKLCFLSNIFTFFLSFIFKLHCNFMGFSFFLFFTLCWFKKADSKSGRVVVWEQNLVSISVSFLSLLMWWLECIVYFLQISYQESTSGCLPLAAFLVPFLFKTSPYLDNLLQSFQVHALSYIFPIKNSKHGVEFMSRYSEYIDR